MTLKPGSKLGRYRVDAVLGRGGMGQVYRGFDAELGRAVALKVMLDADATARARFQREARSASVFSHPNAATVFDVGEADGIPFIVMELIDGETLLVAAGDQTGDPSAPSLAERARWLVDAGRALEAAHNAHLIHRDVKPQNVMITKTGTVKLLDFGIARRIEGAPADGSAPTDAALGTVTEEGGLVGSVAYMSPEQVAGRSLDGRADQFAWAVMAHQVLTGKPVWTSTSSMFSIAAAILHEKPTVDESLPAPVARVLKKCLAKNRDERYATMTDALAAFESALAEDPAAREHAPADTQDADGAVSSSSTGPASVAAASTASPTKGSALGATATSQPKLPIVPVVLGALALGGIGLYFGTRDRLPPVPPSTTSAASASTSSAAAMGSSPAASSASSSSSASPATTEPLTVKCKPDVKLDCMTTDEIRWCLDPDKPLVCCSKGLVATPAGRCSCPDGGTKEKAAIAQGCKESDPHYSDSIREVVRSHFDELKACFEKALATNPKLGGKMTLSFEITNHGAITGLRIGGSSIPDVGFQDCAIAKLQGVSFPPPPDGFVTVGYPIAFASGN